MFDLGWPELLVIAIVLIVVVGPKDLPRMLRTFGRTTAKLRSMAGDFRKQFDEALKEAELDDVKTLASDMRKLDPRSEIKKHLSPLEKAGQDIRSGLDTAMKPQAAKTGAPEGREEEAPAAAKPAAGGSAPAKTAPARAETPAARAKPAKAATAKAAQPSKAKAKPAAKGGVAKAKPAAKTARAAPKPARAAGKTAPKTRKTPGNAS